MNYAAYLITEAGTSISFNVYLFITATRNISDFKLFARKTQQGQMSKSENLYGKFQWCNADYGKNRLFLVLCRSISCNIDLMETTARMAVEFMSCMP